MSEPGRALERSVAAAGPDVLLPPRIAGAVRFGSMPVVRDALTVPGGAILAVVRSGEDFVIAPLVPEHDGVRRARPGDGAFAGLVELLGHGERVGRFGFAPLGPVPAPGPERAIAVDQSNESVVVGERAVVKLLVRSAPGPQPGVDLPAHLVAVGFTELPRPLGSVAWTDPGGEPVLIATVAAFLPQATDGWDWFLALARGWIDGGDERGFRVAARVGGLIARLHAALAAPSAVLPDPSRRADERVAAAWHERALATVEEAVALTSGDEGERLRARADRARDELASLASATGATLTRTHGDLHVGQILEWVSGYVVSDFDGNPLAPMEVRTASDSPARDVAALLRSLDHLARIAQRDGAPADRAQAWSGMARLAFLEGYRDELRERGAIDLFDEALVRPFEIAQASHEFVYAARYLPRWLVVADLAMTALLPGPG